MVKNWSDAAKQAKSEGRIGSYRVSVTSENTATAQIAQIQSLILAHVDAIDIDSASPTALNPVIQKACSAGIKVVVFDSLASAPCEYNVSNDFAAWAAADAQVVIDQLHGHGNVILVQGVVGSQPNQVEVKVQRALLAKNPGIHLVATVDGEGDATTTEQALARVLPSLPKVDGVILPGATSGAVSAFQGAGRPIPVMAFGADGLSLRSLKSIVAKNPGYPTAAIGTDPGQGSAALWESVLLLNGGKVAGHSIPHNVTLPIVKFAGRSDFNQWLGVTSTGDVCSWLWTLPQVRSAIGDQINNRTVPAPPIPTRQL